MENNNIMVVPAVYSKSFRFDTDDGYFLSENNGEFGGKIDFIGNNGVSYTVLERNPHYMFSINDDIYVLGGLAHMTFAVGYIWKLSNINGKWEEEREVELGGDPQVYTIYKGEIYIIVYTRAYDNPGDLGMSELIKVTIAEENIEVQQLVKTITLPTNSMIAKDHMLYVGLRGGLAIVNLKNNNIRFYTKK